MPEEMEKVVKKPGITYHFVKTEKYKTNLMVLKLKAPLMKETATIRALLPYVLQSGTSTYPGVMELRSYLDDLYGATLFVDLQKKGEYHVISISLEIANEKFLTDSEPLLEKGIALLADVLFDPKMENSGFDESIVEKEKRTLKQRIQAVYDDKMRYANLRLVEEMCKGEPYSIPVNGFLDDVDSITAKNLYDYYQQAIGEDEIDLYFVGDIDAAVVETVCDQRFKLKEREPKIVESQEILNKNKENEVIERQDVAQGKLNMGFRTNVSYGGDEYFAMQVFNGLFGGFPHSKLFINVREKESLAYYAASRLESHKGLMMVMTGIEPKNYQKAVQIIKEQLKAMQNGEFTDQDLEQTKAVIQNQMLETLDTSRGLVEVLYHNVISSGNVTADLWKEKINQVTKESLVKVGQKINLDTIYFLSEMEG